MNQDTHNAHDSAEQESGRLETWKGIAGFFSCDESTARRWEKSYGMPVHRYGDRGSGVYAYTHELQAWADEYLEVSPDGAAVIANEESEIIPIPVEEAQQREQPKHTSDLASSSGRMRVLAFAVVVIAAAMFLVFRAHKPASQNTSEANPQVQNAQPADTSTNQSVQPSTVAQASPVEVPKEAPAKPSPMDAESAHASVLAGGPRAAEGTNKLRQLVQANPQALQPKRDLAEALLEQRHVPEALPLLDDIAKLSGDSRDVVTAKALHEGWDSGRTVGAFIALLKADQREYAHDRSVSPEMALASLQLGHNEQALKYLRAAFQDNPSQANALVNGIFATKLASDPAFVKLQRTLSGTPADKPAETH